MKITYKSKTGRFLIEASADTVKDAFAQIGGAAAVFEAESHCGKCNSPDIRPSFRTVGANKDRYYEFICLACKAKFTFGQTRTGDELFPKRKDKEKHPLPNGGWRMFGEADSEGERDYSPVEHPPAPAAKPGRVSEETQGMFDAMAAWLNVSVTPTSFPDALNMMRVAMMKAIGDRAGGDVYRTIHRKHDTEHLKGEPWGYDQMRALFLELRGAMPKRTAA